MRFAQWTAQRPGLMGFSPGLWLRFVARRFGIDNRRRRDAGNEYNQSLSRMVKLRRRQLHACTAIGYVWWQNLAEIIKRPAHHAGKLVRRSMLCPPASQLQSFCRSAAASIDPDYLRVRGPGETDAPPGPVRSRQSWKLGGWKESARRAPDKQKLRI